MPAAQDNSVCIKLSDSQVADELIYMSKLAIQRGFNPEYDSISYTSCGMDRNGAFVVIDPSGFVYNCRAFVGREGFSIGDVYHLELASDEKISESKLERCFKCTYFPVCGGGCRYTAYMLYGDHTKIVCEKSLVEHKTKDLIKLAYDRKAGQRTVA
jgi:uncharacterized protein